jgi:uncharacterized coiled-coil DUF342 family protein
MNKQRRAAITDLADKLSEIRDELQSLCDEESEYRDNMPENMQSGEKYERADTAASILEDGVSELESIIDNLNGIE